MSAILNAIIQKHPTAKFYISNGNLVWADDSIPEPSQSDIDLWISQLKAPIDWDKLTKESGPFMVKAQSTTNANGFSLLLSTLTSIRSVAYLEIALNQVRSGMAQPYTADELKGLNKLFADCNVELILK